MYIWDYTVHSATPTPRTLSLPYAVRPNDKLPLACVVTNASRDLGLVLAYPSSGKITFWENINNAESLRLFDQRRNIAESAIRLSSGEAIEEIIDTETSGLVIHTNFGRLAHVTLRDANGNPHVTATTLADGAKGSFLGSLIPTFASSWRTNPHSVKYRSIGKGRVELVALSQDGILKVWETKEQSNSAFIGELDAHDLLVAALKSVPLRSS